MKCSEFSAQMRDWVTARLGPTERAAFEGHRDSCPRCAAELFTHTEIPCRELIEFLDAYEDDTLEPNRRAVFDRHLDACPPCICYLESYRATIAAGRSIRSRADLPGDLPEELVRAILSARRTS